MISAVMRARRLALGAAALIQTLCFYVAAGVASFGWAVCHLFGWPAAPYLPLWFCSALVIYNADRLRRDPVDALNIPRRAAATARLRSASKVVVTAAAMTLIVLPLMRKDWLTLALIAAGTPVCLNYSAPIFGFRFKDVPLLKTLFAPTIVSIAITGLPWLHDGLRGSWLSLVLIAFLAWCFLLYDMVLCDLRDLEGDRKMGIRSLPVCLGQRGTRISLGLLLGFIEIAALVALAHAPPHFAAPWRLACIAAPLYLGGLLLAVRKPRSEAFYEWWVEGMLFLPAVVCVAG